MDLHFASIISISDVCIRIHLCAWGKLSKKGLDANVYFRLKANRRRLADWRGFADDETQFYVDGHYFNVRGHYQIPLFYNNFNPLGYVLYYGLAFREAVSSHKTRHRKTPTG
ncbi:MAG: hypothetical protein FWB88_01170 [Defluviitaleaceae bacterium]|nr:hypothetical protein [Defluviitaleaceae bacterium]MCL2238408.1 hypothetical protein [Defluviitaleaceae bacterium]